MAALRGKATAIPLGTVRVRDAEGGNWINATPFLRPRRDLVVELIGQVSGRDYATTVALTWQGFAGLGRAVTSQPGGSRRFDLRLFGEPIGEVHWSVDLDRVVADEVAGELRFQSGSALTMVLRRPAEDGLPPAEALDAVTWSGWRSASPCWRRASSPAPAR